MLAEITIPRHPFMHMRQDTLSYAQKAPGGPPTEPRDVPNWIWTGLFFAVELCIFFQPDTAADAMLPMLLRLAFEKLE